MRLALWLFVAASMGCDLDTVIEVAQQASGPDLGARPRRASVPMVSAAGRSGGLDNENTAMGVPYDAFPADDLWLPKAQYVVSYNRFRNAPNWVAWRLRADDLGDTGRTRQRFAPDPQLPSGVYRVLDGDYAGSGYDRGHLCPSASRTAVPEDNAATFLTTNIVPQRHDVNAGAWEDLERWTTDTARQGWDLYIIAGGVWPAVCATNLAAGGNSPTASCPSIGRSNDPARRVAIPLSTWKVILVVPRGAGPESVNASTPVVAVDMPNDGRAGADWHRYITTVDAIEARTGYELFANVSQAAQAMLEATPYAGR